MGRSKTREYRVTVDIQGIIYSNTTVSKAVYDRELVALKRLVSQVGNRDIAVARIEVEDREELTQATYKVTFETSTIELTAIVCKPGYELVDRSKFLPERKEGQQK